ncbi:uncharacterized protein TRIADDRAFT_60726 [Trichoplax adhaerens]|uniref:Uncharacterized protein n=1 Tax=Trichoplax adhaerens TaxID=10228 RepID=B3S976_TRIAD|nr:predicted protein [Trichoplax adhaerens]EDV20821.1 predicted protein [Trichoplax adhaerens]|eukprot:XP_002116762.1 predicted protein [Trichoplax adhaerens]
MGAAHHKASEDLGETILPIGVTEVDQFFASSNNYVILVRNLKSALDKRLKKFDHFQTHSLPDDCYESFKISLTYFVDHLPVHEVKIEEDGQNGGLQLIADNKRLFGNMIDIHQALQQLLEISRNVTDHTPEFIDKLKEIISDSEEFVANSRTLAHQAGLKEEDIKIASNRFINNVKIINQSLADCYIMSECAKHINRDVKLHIGKV